MCDSMSINHNALAQDIPEALSSWTNETVKPPLLSLPVLNDVPAI